MGIVCHICNLRKRLRRNAADRLVGGIKLVIYRA